MSTLRKHVSGAIAKRERSLSVPERHQLRIARASMHANCAMLGVMGGPNHREAVSIIHALTGAIVGINFPCTCLERTQ